MPNGFSDGNKLITFFKGIKKLARLKPKNPLGGKITKNQDFLFP